MRHLGVLLIATLLALAATAGQEPSPRQPDPAKVDRKEAHGQWRLPNDKFVRIHGKVKVIDAHTLRYEDGTEVDLNGGMDAPDLARKGSIDGKLYPAGEEAAAFLRKLVGGRPVTAYADPDEDGAKKKLTKVDAFVGEVSLQHEMMRNGWGMAHHTAMASWESIARENKRGIWRGELVPPAKWRKGERLPGEK